MGNRAGTEQPPAANADQPITVMVPMGGLGTRFQKEGYKEPKPFIRILEKEMILWVLDHLTFREDDELVLVFNPSWLRMGELVNSIIKPQYPRVRIVHLSGETRGAADTVRIGLENVPDDVKKKPVMLVDCDTYYTADIIGMYRANSLKNASFVFHDTQKEPKYSYCTLDEGSDPPAITSTKEKVKISDWANSGCYCFASGDELLRECNELLNKKKTQKSQDGVGEYYTSGVITQMLDKKRPFVALKLETQDITVLGTPAQVRAFEGKLAPNPLRCRCGW
jgi:NDP-sugar pyrophosphorylase family protein